MPYLPEEIFKRKDNFLLVLKMVFRNILRQKRRSFLTWSIMTAGFVLISLSIGLAEGSFSSILELITRNNSGHIQIHKKGYLDNRSIYNTINVNQRVGERVASSQLIQSWSSRLYSTALAFAGNQSIGIRVIGIDPYKEAKTIRIKQKIKKGRYLTDTDEHIVMITDSLAKALNLSVGEDIVLIGQGADGSIANDLFKVVGIYGSEGIAFGAMDCYMPIQAAQSFFSLYDRFHEIVIVLDREEESRQTAGRLAGFLNDPTLDVDPWQVVNREFYKVLQTDRNGRNLSFLIIMFVVGTGILDTVLMGIFERTREFGVMRALGTRKAFVFRLIIYEIFCLAVASIIIGGIIAFIANYILLKHGIPLPEPIHFAGVCLDRMVSEISVNVFLLPAAVTLITSFLVSLYPGYRAVSMAPIEAIRSR